MSAIRISEERGVRYLHFGARWVQGAMRMSRPFALELEYTREMMFPLLVRDGDDWPARALVIGLGAASLVKFLHRHRPACSIGVVELRDDVLVAAARFFRLPDDPARIDIVIGDGAEFVARTGPRYDIVLVDGYDAKGRVGALDTPVFYERCRARLRDDGILATNLLGRRGVEPTLARMQRAFDGRAMALPPCGSGNVIALAATGAPAELDARVLNARARALRESTGLDLAGTVGRLTRSPPASGRLL
jgi:spermidine synthase